jgi:hypothetical protein
MLDVRRTNDVVPHVQGVAANGGFLYHDSVGEGMQAEGFAI